MSSDRRPDSRIFASYPMPPKIDLLDERPRRESLIENRLSDRVGQISSSGPSDSVPKITVTVQSKTTTSSEDALGAVMTNSSGAQPLPSMNMSLNSTISNNKAILEAELAEKEAKLMKEITALHQRPYNPYQTPAKIDLTSEQRIIQQQYRNAPQPVTTSRSNSRASNRSNVGDDLLEKEAKLLKEIEEIESKPYNPQTMIVEREKWYEYPEDRPYDRHLVDSKRRIRDFCSMPPGLCQDKHIHEENLQPKPSITPESIQTTIIRSPKREIDNKSPLPFSFDNFSTKGVRGNIASVGAVEPERPPPPIFPIVKRLPSHNAARG